MESPELHPGKLLELSGSYWQTCTLHGGVKLDIFTSIGDRSLTLEEIAGENGAPARSLGMLLDALAAMKLLEKKGGRYSNTPVSNTFLSKSSQRYIGFIIMHHHHLVESWSKLGEAVMTGKKVRSEASTATEEVRESFLMGMFNIAMSTAPSLVPTLDLSGRKNLLDLGGGPGTYAIQFALYNPDLKAVVFDLPTTRHFAEKTIKKFGVQDRVSFQEGNFLESDITGRYDVVWLSQILHGDSPSDCEKIISKAASALEQGGIAIVHEFILNNDKDGPLFPALFSLNMLLGTEGGQAYSEKEIMDMLQKAGFTDIMRTPYRGPMDSGLIIGKVDK